MARAIRPAINFFIHRDPQNVKFVKELGLIVKLTQPTVAIVKDVKIIFLKNNEIKLTTPAHDHLIFN